MHFSKSWRKLLSACAVALALGACSVLQPDAHLAAFSTQMTGQNQVPPVATVATGRVDAVLDKNTRLFRWKLSFTGMRSPVTSGHFHGPAPIGGSAPVALNFSGPVKSPFEGRATLTAAQAQDLLSGKWYINLHTEAHPGGEIRGQMILRE
ncbi:MAG: CHRD domain-containing protein [Rhodoferax sp.]|uniref:CHRD domain-containing protein n=1 Tax=Rhodoferax sp. TaxID=50421 RepID=UPI00301B66DD